VPFCSLHALAFFCLHLELQVWLARWGLHDVAVKKLNASLLMIDAENTSKEFQDEINFMRGIRHRNIVLFVHFIKYVQPFTSTDLIGGLGFWVPALKATCRFL
jgi:hypothetical protein